MSKHYRWDLFVRLTHWIVAVSFFANFLLTEEGGLTHRWVGYTVIVTVSLRLLWGLIVKSPARLSAFKPSVSGALEHLSEVFKTKEDRHEGHNPAGAIMVWVLWSGLLLTGLSGWATQWDVFWGESWLEDVHETAANLTMAAVVIHVSAVIFMTHWTKHNYIRAMWFRNK
ncbi:hypothetical protein VA7868_02944 [Vibrio aerogenes CECT 7868]|uniref:Cytochrome b561 bacterial/Ni-hydrogenase domain-containing protein n=1 Tax=Vibrio aerogenes CECT 7868 TaxID=1216006 RepID=A0A1M5ZMK2_9VIBR|nr:cytochrome b/b6 domain-containing protein [Vibrio aerogenes]SHI25411.1 hypothetical protein VA7868_02944 [Vibrio aerogenes CECT 7868]